MSLIPFKKDESQVYRIPLANNFLENAAEIICSLNTSVSNIKDLHSVVFLPNKRSCRELKKYLLKKNNVFLPKLMPVFNNDDQTLIMSIVNLLKSEKQNVPFNTLYELAESLCSLINELILNNVDFDQLTSAIPEDLQKYWKHTIDVINEVTRVSSKTIELIKEKLSLEFRSVENQKIIVLGIGEANYYAKSLIKKATESGIVITNSHEQNFKETVDFLEFDSIFDEGYAIAVATRKAIFEQKSVLIVSPDQNLTEIVKSELKRWNIFADDSRGTIFSKTTDGILVSLIIDMMKERYSTTSVLRVLKMSISFSEIAQKLEMFFRISQVVPSNFRIALNLYPEKDEKLFQLTELMISIGETASFAEWFDICYQLTYFINPESANILLDISSKFLPISSTKMTLEEFDVFFKNHVISQPVRSATGYTPNVVILGAIEAQILDADFTIIASVNEESWTSSFNKNDFWMTESMLKHFGMQSSDMKNEFLRNIFKRFMHKKNVLVTRSKWIDGVQQQKYRYMEKFSEISPQWLVELLSINKTKRETIQFTPPNPDLSLRPQHFWTSDLDLLINNPYAFYAKKILKLVEIRSINELSRGNYVHNVLEDFIRYAANKKDINELRKIAQKVLKNKWLEPLDFGLWYFRLDKILSFVVKNMEEKKYYVEVRGSCFVNISEDYRVKLSSKADRIDVDQHGHISIIDYKTNTLPSKASVSDGRKIQLPLEAIIAQNAGFGLKETEVESLCYWELKNPSGDKNIMYVAKTLEEVQELTQKNLKILKDLIYKYNISGSAYDVDVDYPYEKSYMHLARVKEWNNV